MSDSRDEPRPGADEDGFGGDAPEPAQGWASLDDDQLLEALETTNVPFEGGREAAIAALEALDAEAEQASPAPAALPLPDEPPVAPAVDDVDWSFLGEGDHEATLWHANVGGHMGYLRECTCGWTSPLATTPEAAADEFSTHLATA